MADVATEPLRPVPQRPTLRLSRTTLTCLIAAVVILPPTIVTTIWAILPPTSIPRLNATVAVSSETPVENETPLHVVLVRNDSTVVWTRIMLEIRGKHNLTARYQFFAGAPLPPGETLRVPTEVFVTHWGNIFPGDLAAMDRIAVNAQRPDGSRALLETPIVDLPSTLPEPVPAH